MEKDSGLYQHTPTNIVQCKPRKHLTHEVEGISRGSARRKADGHLQKPISNQCCDTLSGRT